MKYRDTPTILRVVYTIIGWCMVVLGVVGAFLPLLPTVPFLLVAAWCFARSSPRFHNWLYNHPTFGPPIQNWEKNGAITTKYKYIAIGSMAGGYCIFWALSFYFGHLIWWLLLAIAIILIAVAVYIATRPSH